MMCPWIKGLLKVTYNSWLNEQISMFTTISSCFCPKVWLHIIMRKCFVLRPHLCTLNNSERRCCIPIYAIFHKRVADKMISQQVRWWFFFLHLTLSINQCRISFGKFELSDIRPWNKFSKMVTQTNVADVTL